MRTELALVSAVLLLGPACIGESGGGSTTPSGSTDCTAVMRWMQKDAYAEYAGRTSSSWPPHTTMQLSVDCNSGVFSTTTEQQNHGTLVSAVDDAGTSILDEMRKETVGLDRADAVALKSAFDDCQCGDTEFLSMDKLSDSLVQDVVGDLVAYMTANMVCTGASPATIAGLLQADDPDAALAELNDCTWNSGHDWETAFNTSLASAGGALDDYHVCNNDAMLQSELWDDFMDGAGVGSCNPNASMCHGPEFFYTP